MASLIDATRSQPLCFPVDVGNRRQGWCFPSSLRFGFDRRLGNGKKTRHVGSPPPPSVASPTIFGWRWVSLADPNHKILRLAREKFVQEISFRSDDKDVSLAKALLLVAAEDEAFMLFNRDLDAYSFLNERKAASDQFKAQSEVENIEDMSLAGKNISGWLNELDVIAKEVEAELISRGIGCHLLEVLEAVNVVLFESRSFKRYPLLVDSKFSYLHTVLSTGCGSAIMFSILYVEVCQRLGVTILGSRVGEEFFIWPKTGNPMELFRIASGISLFDRINGKSVKHPRSKASELDSNLLLRLDIASKREIIGIALSNLVRLYWKRASKANHGFLLTSPLKPVQPGKERASSGETSNVPLLRPQDLRMAIMASERLLILQPDNWTLRRDHGLLLYHSRRYGEAVQELSICMAFAPEEEAKILEPFVEKLHLLRLLSTWECLDQAGSVPVP